MRTAFAAAAGLLLACIPMACTSPNDPQSRFVDLEVVYTFVPPSGPAADPGVAAGCAHHNAPANLRIRTNWSDETVMFEQTNGTVHQAELQARRGGDYWITFADIRLCQIADATVVPAAVAVNDVILTRSRLTNGTLVFRFSIDQDGALRDQASAE